MADLIGTPDQPLVVAVSGGRDSVVLLHLLRFHSDTPAERLHVAHFDHATRPGSRGDALWVQGLCTAWGVACVSERGEGAHAGEAQSRDARYAFLQTVRARVGARWILTAHHADDQAETVLFRALRGAGPHGLAGMRDRTGLGVARPLLRSPGARVELHAARHGVRYRPDPTNRDLGYARNLLRRVVLPSVEAGVAPGARASLARLADIMAGIDETVCSLAEATLAGLVRESDADALSLERTPLLRLPEPARSAVLRAAARSLGTGLDAAGTRLALEVTSHGASGKAVDLGGGLRLGREFDSVRLDRSGPRPADRALRIEGPGDGQGSVRLGGRTWTVRWSGSGRTSPLSDSFSVEGLAFPLTIRGWRPGDRIRLPYGTKKLKKLFREVRMPRSARGSHPLLVDADGRVVWIPTVARSLDVASDSEGPVLHVEFDDA